MNLAQTPLHTAAVDLGATSGRVIVGIWNGERLELDEVHRFPNQFRTMAGHEYWDFPYLWSEVKTGLLKAKAKYAKLASIGVDTWAVDYALVDAAGRLVFPTHAYRDSRAQPFSEKLGLNGVARIYSMTGIPNSPLNTSVQLQETLQNYPGIAGMAERCLFVSDYFNFLLSGKMENEFSICSHSQLLDVSSKQWSQDALQYFGVPPKWFSTPALSPRTLGPVLGIPELANVQSILVPGHDTASAFTAMPAAADGSDLYLSTGTWSLLGFEAYAPLLGEEALAARVSNERMGDGRYRPLRASLGLWVLEQTLPHFTGRPSTDAGWERLFEEASRESKPERLLDLSDSALFNPPDMKAAIDAQLTSQKLPAPATLSQYVRLICDSISASHAATVRTFERLSGRQFKRILIVGGGSKNRLLCQGTANAAGLPVVSLSLEGSAVGNIASQLIGLGAVESLNAFRALFSKQVQTTLYHPSTS